MAATVACPRCQRTLEIPRPAPEKIRCDGCGAVIKNARMPAEDTMVPVGQATLMAEPAAARHLASLARGLPTDADSRLPEKPAASTAGLKIGIAVAVLLLATLGGVAAWVVL